MYLKFLEPVIEEFTTGQYYKEVFNAKKEFFDKSGMVFEEDPEFEQRMSIFMDWYIFDRELPTIDLTPIRYFYKKNKDTFNDDQLKIHNDFCNTKHSLFKMIKKTLFSNALIIKDLFESKKYKITDSEIKDGFSSGDVFEGRIIPFRGSFEISAGICFHPVEMRSFILNEIHKIKHQDHLKHNKLIFELSSMKLKHLRFQHIDVKHIYQFGSKF